MRRHVMLGAALAVLAVGTTRAQDPEAGRKVFSLCRACHQVGEKAKNTVGPVLNGVIGRKAGSVEGYKYTPAAKNSELTWDEVTFVDYIKNPKAKVPGTRMVDTGLKDDQKINDLIAYLKQFGPDGKKVQ